MERKSGKDQNKKKTKKTVANRRSADTNAAADAMVAKHTHYGTDLDNEGTRITHKSRFPLHKRRFQRVCQRLGQQPREVLKAAFGQSGAWANEVLNGKPLPLARYAQLEAYLARQFTGPYSIEGDYFMDRGPVPLGAGAPHVRFAERVEELIFDGSIPHNITKANGEQEKTDVVRYVWQMQDPVLKNLRLTYAEQHEAFYLLVDWDLLEEQKREKLGDITETIGRMHRVPFNYGLLEFDLDVREAIEIRAAEKIAGDRELLLDAQRRFWKRFGEYKALAPERDDEDAPPPHEFRVEVRHAIDLDLDCRRVLLPSGPTERSLKALYRGSLYAILSKRRREQERARQSANAASRFPQFWHDFYYENRSSLEALGFALGRPGSEAPLAPLKAAVIANISATRTLLKTLRDDPEYVQDSAGV